MTVYFGVVGMVSAFLLGFMVGMSWMFGRYGRILGLIRRQYALIREMMDKAKEKK